MVGEALDVCVLSCDGKRRSYVRKEADERSIMSRISLVFSSVISSFFVVESICLWALNSHSTGDKSRNITFTALVALVLQVIHLPSSEE